MDAPKDVDAVLGEFYEFKTELENFVQSEEYKNLVAALNREQVRIKTIDTTSSSSEKTTFSIRLTDSQKTTDFSVANGTYTPGCYITKSEQGDSASGDYYVRLYFSAPLDGTKMVGDEYYADLIWPKGDPGTDWEPPSSDEASKKGDNTFEATADDEHWHNYATLRTTGMSTSMTGLNGSVGFASVGVTGVSWGISLISISMGILSEAARGSDSSANGHKSDFKAFCSRLFASRNEAKVSNEKEIGLQNESDVEHIDV